MQKNTVLRVLHHAGMLCRRVMESRMRNLYVNYLQVDEIWGFVGKKETNVLPEERNNGQHVGDIWLFLGIDAETKLVPTFALGERDMNTAQRFMQDVAGRIANRLQITTDGCRGFMWAVEERSGQIAITGCSSNPTQSGMGVWSLRGATTAHQVLQVKKDP